MTADDEAHWLQALRAGMCPDCGGHDQHQFRDGPRGGLAQNIECRQCGARFNVTRLVVMAQRIPRRDEGGSDW